MLGRERNNGEFWNFKENVAVTVSNVYMGFYFFTGENEFLIKINFI